MSSIALKLWFTVQFRAATVLEEQRVPAILFVGEFQELQSLGILKTLLAQPRSFKLVLWLSHQNLSQLNEELLKTVLGNTAVQIAGPVSGEDARRHAEMDQVCPAALPPHARRVEALHGLSEGGKRLTKLHAGMRGGGA
ncbi:MAG: hypothetical protein QW334_03765 [Thermofilum sp.]